MGPTDERDRNSAARRSRVAIRPDFPTQRTGLDMIDHTDNELALLQREGIQSLELAERYARALEAAARRIACTAKSGEPAHPVGLRSTAMHLQHAATDALNALVLILSEAARLDSLATVRKILDAQNRSTQ